MLRICPRCQKEKSEAEFLPSRGRIGKQNKRRQCSSCRLERKKEIQQKHYPISNKRRKELWKTKEYKERNKLVTLKLKMGFIFKCSKNVLTNLKNI